MGYIGKTPTDVPLSSDDLSDGIVTSAKLATGIDATKLADGSVTSTELQYINTLSSNAQTQIDGAGGADTSLSNLTATGGNKVCQAWVNFQGNGTVAIRDSYNVSSITDNATGNWTVNFSNALNNANYSAISEISRDVTPHAGNIRTSKCEFYATGSVRVYGSMVTTSIAAAVDQPRLTVIVFGDPS